MIIETENYIQVYEDCPFRKGLIIVLQVSKADWLKSQYDRYRN